MSSMYDFSHSKMNSMITAPEIPTSDTPYRCLMEDRKRRSIFWQVIYLLGSLQLALILLTILAIACAVATFTEASFNTKIAQATLYKAPWFVFWLALLCVNLFSVTLTRWPWRRKHLGFVTTHYGIILLLVGALMGATWGFEGNVTLHTHAAPTTQVITNQNVIQIESPLDGRIYRTSFDPEVTPPSPTHLRRFSVPGTSLILVASAVSTSLHNEPQLAVSSLPEAPAGALLELSSSVAPTPIRVPLLLNPQNSKFDFFGLAQIHFLVQLPRRPTHTVSETRIIFSHHPPVIEASEGNTGWTVELSADGKILTLTDPAHKSRALSVATLLGHSIPVSTATFSVDAFWPDFEMRAGQPASASPFPRNPAVLVRIQAPVWNGTHFPLFEMSPDPDDPQNTVRYQLSRGGVIYASGKLTKGTSLATGWADWKARLSDFLPSASLIPRLIPSPKGSGVTGFQVFLQSRDGTRGPPEWVAPGIIPTLFHRDGFVRIAYGWKLQPLPFSIQLKNFEIPRYEGTATPSNYISTLSFRDLKTGTQKQAIAKMNHPANFPGSWWAAITGLNYKFSQAQWNPADLKETTLQVLYDPGWLLKWVGSLAICTGIALMFYFTPKRL